MPEEMTWGGAESPYYGQHRRTISMFGPIDEEMAERVISQLWELDAENDEPICIHLNTEGGSLSDAFAIYDIMKTIAAPVVIMTMGSCMSAGLLILCGADLRIATPNTVFFYHEMIISDVSFNAQQQISSLHEFYQKSQTDYNRIVKERTRISKTVWNKEFEGKTSKFFSATEALEWKFIDHLTVFPKKAKLKVGSE